MTGPDPSARFVAAAAALGHLTPAAERAARTGVALAEVLGPGADRIERLNLLARAAARDQPRVRAALERMR